MSVSYQLQELNFTELNDWIQRISGFEVGSDYYQKLGPIKGNGKERELLNALRIFNRDMRIADIDLLIKGKNGRPVAVVSIKCGYEETNIAELRTMADACPNLKVYQLRWWTPNIPPEQGRYQVYQYV